MFKWTLRAVLVLVAVLVGLPLPIAAMICDTTTVSDADMQAALKIIFDDAIVNSAVTDSELLDYMEEGDGIQTERTTGGRYIETAQMFALPAGVGARADNGYIPVPSGPTIVNGRVNLRKIVGTVEMTAGTMKMVRTDIGAFIDWASRALPSLVERVTNELDRMMIGYGAGIKARVNAASPSTNLIVDSPMGIGGLGSVEATLLQFLEGETLRAGPNFDGSSLRAGVMTVEAINFDGGFIRTDALATALANNDFLFPGDAADNSAGLEPMGLFGMIDDGQILPVFQNIDRTTYLRWQAYVNDAGGGQLTENLIILTEKTAYVRGGAKVDTLVTNEESIIALWQDIKGDRRLIGTPEDYDVGKGPIRFLCGSRWLDMRSCRKLPNVLFGLSKETFRSWYLHRWEWDTTVGSLWRQVTDSTGRKDAFYTYGSMYLENGNRDPQKNFRIENYSTAITT